jgi:pyroglutamyl-peptidase
VRSPVKSLAAAPAQPSWRSPGVLLLTGFEPFGGDSTNSSQVVAQALHGQMIGGLTVVAVVLPCVFATAPQALRQALEQWQPRLVLALGQAAGRFELSLERVAINLVDAPLADNAGQQPSDAPVVAGGPPAHFTTLPVKAMVNAMRNADLPAGLSNSAGTFVCNQVFYCLQQQLVDAQSTIPSGFMHLPLLPEQAAERGVGRDSAGTVPSLPLQDMVRGVGVALTAACEALTGLSNLGDASPVPGPGS